MLPFPDSLCHRCAARRHVRTRTSIFVLCTALPDKYPRQPVLRCDAYRPEQPAGGAVEPDDPAGEPPND